MDDLKQIPIQLFREWFEQAKTKEVEYPEAMAVATANADGRPSVRMVLLKAYDDRGFVFYTNLTSRKSRDLQSNQKAELLFHWKTMHRQIRINGKVELVTNEEADKYFATRDRISQLGAWASKQSQKMEGRFSLEARVAKCTAKFHVGKVPRPEFWSGYRVIPDEMEFWDEKPFRLHDRFVYIREGDKWEKSYLFP